jgi:hypothetical protein
MKVLLALLSLILCIELAASAVITLEEGNLATARTMKWYVDPQEEVPPTPRFLIQNGKDQEWERFDFLATLDCSAADENDVVMAIYDIGAGQWGCVLTGDLPSDEGIPTGQPEGLLLSCDEPGRVAVWSRTTVAWGCSAAKPLLDQAEPNVQSSCRSGDLLTVNLAFDGRPAALCDTSTTRQVGPNALVSLKKRSAPRNLGDPDEAFYIQTTSKAIGRASDGQGQWGWQYWKWSPTKTSFASSMGTFPPLFPFTGNLAAVTATTYTYSGNSFSATTLALTFRVVKITPGPTSFTALDWSDDLRITQSPATFVSNGSGSPLKTDAIVTGQAASVRLISVPTSLSGGSHTSSWVSFSLWISHIQVET